jgi:hypothetical protein
VRWLPRALHRSGCENLARLGLRYADAGGRPITNLAYCHGHGRLVMVMAA